MPRRGPFGFWAGMSKEDVNLPLEEIAAFKFSTASAPRPHSAFERYVLRITPNSGLSWIKALGPTLRTSPYGETLRASFETMSKKLAATYGPPEISDFLMPDSIWDQPRDWMMGLSGGERFLHADWKASPSLQLPDDLDSIFLSAIGLDDSSGYIAIEYEFTNHQAADREISSLEDDAL